MANRFGLLKTCWPVKSMSKLVDIIYDRIHIRALEHIKIGKRDESGAAEKGGNRATWFEAARGHSKSRPDRPNPGHMTGRRERI